MNAFYCSTSLVEAYSNFETDISFSTFFKYVPDHFKKPHRFSDLCDYCEVYKSLKKEMSRFLNTNSFTGDSDSLKEINDFFKRLFTIHRINE